MTDRIAQILDQARADALRDVRPPGSDEIRRTVRRRRGLLAGTGTAVAVAAVAVGGALAVPPGPGTSPPSAGSSPSAGFPMMPEPDPAVLRRSELARAALGDPDVTPWVMATTGVVSADYANHVNDIPAGDYDLFVYCVGEGTVDTVVKAGNYGDEKLAAGSVTCAESPAPARLTVRQPVDGYLRVFLNGDSRASAGSAMAFKFVRVDPTVTAGADSTANAAGAAALLTGSATAMTTERDRTAEKPLAAGRYLIGFACKGPGKLAFTVRSAGVLRDGTVATNGRTELSVDRECTAAGRADPEVPVTLPAGSAITVTAAADDTARNRAGWAYTVRPA